MVQLITDDVLEKLSLSGLPSSVLTSTCVQGFKSIGCWIVPVQIAYSSEGRALWYKVLMNYTMYFVTSSGIWTDDIVKQLSLMERFRAFEKSIASVKDDPDAVKTMENPIYTRDSIRLDSGSSIFNINSIILSERSSALSFSKSDEGSSVIKETFAQYLSAITSCRSIMWQLIPGMTGFAILAVDTSMCPVFVFSERMRLTLPSLLEMNARDIEEKRLQHILKHQPENWQISLATVYICMTESRAVQFALQIFVNLIAFYIVISGYVFITLHKIFFDDHNHESFDSAVVSLTTWHRFYEL
eukprot:gene27393-36029_t